MFGSRRPNGRNTPVTEKNKKVYIEAVTRWRHTHSVEGQTEALLSSFHELLEPKLLVASGLDARDLELLLAGIPELDVADWKINTDYRCVLVVYIILVYILVVYTRLHY